MKFTHAHAHVGKLNSHTHTTHRCRRKCVPSVRGQQVHANERSLRLHDLRLPAWAGSERLRGDFPGGLRVLRNLPARRKQARVRRHCCRKLRGVWRRQVQDVVGDKPVCLMRGGFALSVELVSQRLRWRLGRRLRRLRRLSCWCVSHRVRKGLAGTLCHVRTWLVQDQLRIRAL
jgi:hypothetical protein